MAVYIFPMDALHESILCGDPPSLVLPAQDLPGHGPHGGKPAAGARAGLMGPGEIGKAVAALAKRLPARPDPDRLRVLEGLALLWHDHWDAAHEIAQSREGDPDHDLLHAMLHRREGDFANAGYWFGMAGKHPCYPLIARRLSSAAGPGAAGLQEGGWSAKAFLAAVRASMEGSEEGAGGGRRPTSSASPSGSSLVLAQAEEFRAFAAYLMGS
jgi:hypothetical protein